MPKLLVLSFAALVFAVPGCAPPDNAPVAPSPTTTTVAPAVDGDAPDPVRVPVAPMPHLPRKALPVPPEAVPEKPLINDDLGLDPKIETALPEIDRLDQKTVDEKVTQDNIGQPNTTTVPGFDEPRPSTFAGRTGATKTRLLKEGGGNAESERAVALGLAWLTKQQLKDGNWKFDAGSLKDDTAAATGLALLPYLGAGITHKKKEEKDFKGYDAVVKQGLDFLVKQCPLSGAGAGQMSADPVGQALATLALAEAYAMTKDQALRAPAQAAVNHIQRKQEANGGWAGSGDDRDISLVGWQISALKAAKSSKDLVVDDRVIAKANKFLDATAAGSRKSSYGQKDGTDAAPGTGLTAVGLLCRYYISEWGPTHPGMADGVAGLMKNPSPTGAIKNLYYYHHATQVVRFYEGDDWKIWNEGPKQADGTRKGGLRDWLTAAQNKKELTAGSWDTEEGWFGTTGGRLGTTAAALLTLEVYYRHLPLYKRGADGKAIQIIE